MITNNRTFSKYLAQYSPRHTPSDYLKTNEYLRKTLSMVHDCYLVALREQDKSPIINTTFPVNPISTRNGGLYLLGCIEYDYHLTTADAISGVMTEVLEMLELGDARILIFKMLEEIYECLKTKSDVSNLRISPRLNEIFRCFKNGGTPTPAVVKTILTLDGIPTTGVLPHSVMMGSAKFSIDGSYSKIFNEILKDIYNDKKEKDTKAIPSLKLCGLGILGERDKDKPRWRGIAYVRSQEDNTVSFSYHEDFASKDEAISWAEKSLKDCLITKNDSNDDLCLYSTSRVDRVIIKEMKNV